MTPLADEIRALGDLLVPETTPPVETIRRRGRQRRFRRRAATVAGGACVTLAVGSTVFLIGQSAGDGADVSTAPAQTEQTATATTERTRSQESRAYFVATMDELSARADAVVVGTKGDSGRKEPADEQGRSGLSMTTTPFAVSEWIKGEGPDSVQLSEMNPMQMEDETADVRPGGEYVLFLEKVTYKEEPRYILIGGVGAYKVGADGSLSRTDEAEDTFPQSYTSVSQLTRTVNSAPPNWTKTP